MEKQWILLFLVNLAVAVSQSSSDGHFTEKRSPKAEMKRENFAAPYNDEMFNFDTLAGIGLGKRFQSPQWPQQRYEDEDLPNKRFVFSQLGRFNRPQLYGNNLGH